MGRILTGVLFGLFLAGNADAALAADPSPGAASGPAAERVPVRVVGVYCDAPACARDTRDAWGHGTAFAAAALAALWMRRRRDCAAPPSLPPPSAPSTRRRRD